MLYSPINFTCWCCFIYTFYLFFNTLPQSFYIVQSPKKLRRLAVRPAGSNPRRIPRLPPPPLILTLYYLGEEVSGGLKKYTVAKYLSGGGKIIRAGAGAPKIQQKFRKKSHRAENCRTVPKIPYSMS